MTPGRGTGAGSDSGPGEVPHRVRVTAPQREARRRADRPSRSAELAQQTALGEIYLAALLRAQLRLGLAVLSVAAVVLAGIPLLFLLVPAVATTRIGPAPLPWVVVGLAVYPVVAFGARFYVAQCERLERDFVELVSQQMNSAYAVSAVTLVCLATVVIGAVGLRLSRTTSDFYVASRVVSPGWNAAAICGEYLSAASFLGVAGLVYTNGVDMLWYPVGYTVGYLVLLVLVAAPLRRSGAYTLPDFAEARLESRAVRLMASLLVVGIGWLYLLPQFQGAGLTLATVAGAPPWVGRTVVAAIVLAAVGAGGMRSITFVQAVQYWIKLTAISIPAFILLWAWARGGQPAPWDAGGGTLAEWSRPLVDHGPRQHATYTTYSTLLALCLGTMGLPHVLVRFYTNPDGRAARRTTVTVIALLGAFYIFTPVYGVLGRIYLPSLGAGVRADSVTLLLPQAVVPGVLGDVLGAVLAGGAFAAFLSTASGLTVSVTGVIDQDLIDPLLSRHIGGDTTRIQQFRIASVVAVAVPYVASSVTPEVPLADIVGLAFAVAASTFCPLLLLGVWWPRLSVPGAASGMLTGGLLASAAAIATMFGVGGSGWAGALLAQPAAWTIPIAFAVSVIVSLATPSRVPAGALRTMVRLHAPEALTGAADPVA